MVQALLGIAAFLALAFAISEDKQSIRWRTIGTGLLIQVVLALALLKIPPLEALFMKLNGLVLALEAATQAGTGFVFGYLGGNPLPFEEPFPGAGFILAFKALPIVLVVSALSSLFFYWGIIPKVVRFFALMLQKAMGIGGALGLGTAANIFVGMVEAPLFVRPYLSQMTRSELFTLMTCGMATIAGTVMVLYANILQTALPDALGHILIASLISAPAAILISQLMVPESQDVTEGDMVAPHEMSSSMDAITQGTRDGLGLLLNIVAMLIVLVALVALVNQGLALIPVSDGQPWSLQGILGYLMAPVTWLMGVPWAEAQTAGALMGTKTVLNEFLAYLQMSQLPEGALSPRSQLIMTYAMCGFANFGSLGIMLGGLCTMAEDRRDEIVGLGLKSIVSGTLATCLTGAVVGLIL